MILFIYCLTGYSMVLFVSTSIQHCLLRRKCLNEMREKCRCKDVDTFLLTTVPH